MWTVLSITRTYKVFRFPCRGIVTRTNHKKAAKNTKKKETEIKRWKRIFCRKKAFYGNSKEKEQSLGPLVKKLSELHKASTIAP